MIFYQNDTPVKKYSRIISLVPSLTELLYDLGLNEEVVGITKFCVHPQEWFHVKRRIGGTKNVHFEIVDELLPDLIIANKEENVKEQIEILYEKYDVLLTDVNDLPEALEMIQCIGKFTQRQNAAEKMAAKIGNQFALLSRSLSPEKEIKTAYFIWKNPYMVAGQHTFIDVMMTYCGFENIYSRQNRYPEITLQQLEENGCEMILLSSEPYPFKQKEKEEIQQILPDIKIKLVDGEMFSWYGSRLLLSVEYFKGLIKEIE